MKPLDSCESFAPIAGPIATTLILGSMPGRVSLAKQQYYAHPRNHFWRIIGELLGFEPTASYRDRKSLLKSRQIAVWDVLKSCTRESSLDSDIVGSSIIPNDFPSFFRRHRAVQRVFFNGAKAEQVYRRHVAPALDPARTLSCVRLPSTSPAHAAMPYAEKLRAWAAVIS